MQQWLPGAQPPAKRTNVAVPSVEKARNAGTSARPTTDRPGPPKHSNKQMRAAFFLLLFLSCVSAFSGLAKPSNLVKAFPQVLKNRVAFREAHSTPARTKKRVKLNMVITPEFILPALGVACLSPTLLGLWKNEYTVSYGNFHYIIENSDL